MPKCKCGEDHPDWVEASAIEKATKAAEAKVTAATAKVTDLETQLASTSKKVSEVEGQLQTWTAKEQTWSVERAVTRAGITDDEGLAFTVHAWERVPEANRPKGGISEWISAKDALPKGVRAYLPEAAAAGGAAGGANTTTTTPAAANPLPRAGAGVDPKGSAPAPGRFTAEQIRAMSLDEFRTHQAAILAQHKAEQGS
jgi:hypothetical protein